MSEPAASPSTSAVEPTDSVVADPIVEERPSKEPSPPQQQHGVADQPTTSSIPSSLNESSAPTTVDACSEPPALLNPQPSAVIPEPRSIELEHDTEQRGEQAAELRSEADVGTQGPDPVAAQVLDNAASSESLASTNEMNDPAASASTLSVLTEPLTDPLPGPSSPSFVSPRVAMQLDTIGAIIDSDIFTGSTLSPLGPTPPSELSVSMVTEDVPNAAAPSSVIPMKRMASLVDDSVVAPATHAPPPPATSTASEPPAIVDPWSSEDTPVYKAAKNASQWNSLLRWARHQRGPQWDYATGQYHVDRNTPEYFAGVTRTSNASALPSHLSNNPSVAGSPAFSGAGGPGTPAAHDAGVYDSGRPRRSRAGGR